MLEKAWEQALQSSALVLSVINGLILLRVHLRNRARLKVSPVHPDAYQWWFELPGAAYDGVPTRLYGFLLYVAVANRGYRAVTLDNGGSSSSPRTGAATTYVRSAFPSPLRSWATTSRSILCLARQAHPHQANMRVDPGDSVSGMAFFVYECPQVGLSGTRS